MKISVNDKQLGQRLDKVLATSLPEYSRSSLVKLVEDGLVTVNSLVKPASYKLKINDEVSIDLEPLKRPVSEIEIPVIYEDNDVVVLNKPAGILTHSKGEFNKEGTVATFIQSRLNGDELWKSTNRAGIVHRLDRGTSGVIICAKNKKTEDYLKGQFSKRNVKKTYVAVISGKLPENEGMIDIPIERNPKKPATFRAGVNGKTAQTRFEVIKSNGKYSVVELKPITGRTHQLRVHLNYLGHPIVGDEFYKGETAPRLMLHALKLEVTLPSRERKQFEVPLPTEFKEYM